ncbi:MAG: hypothetical protein HQM10_13490 [Candidatus Riflebacteria bacterium]|nr:hypothetical protein [Candidatus Riflebacteria bacterium]
MEWLAAVCSHIPNPRQQTIRYYGYYSNVSRGKREKEGVDNILPSISESLLTGKEFRRNWARLIQKIYEVDPLLCPKCNGSMKIISFIEEKSVIEKILKHLSLWLVQSRNPPRSIKKLSFDDDISLKKTLKENFMKRVIIMTVLFVAMLLSSTAVMARDASASHVRGIAFEASFEVLDLATHKVWQGFGALIKYADMPLITEIKRLTVRVTNYTITEKDASADAIKNVDAYLKANAQSIDVTSMLSFDKYACPVEFMTPTKNCTLDRDGLVKAIKDPQHRYKRFKGKFEASKDLQSIRLMGVQNIAEKAQ